MENVKAETATSQPKATRGGQAAADVAASLRTAIMQQHLMPGEQVRQDAWSKRFGVSRFPLREALRTLTAEGLLTHDAHRGYFVTKVQTSDVIQLYRMRLLLEPEAVRSLRRPDEATLQRLRGYAEACEQALADNRPDVASEAEQALHFEIFDLSPYQRIVEEVRRLWTLSEIYRTRLLGQFTDQERSRERHANKNRETIDAVDRGDIDLLSRILIRTRCDSLRGMGLPEDDPLLARYTAELNDEPRVFDA